MNTQRILVIPKHVDLALKATSISYDRIALMLDTNNDMKLDQELGKTMSKLDLNDMNRLSLTFQHMINAPLNTTMDTYTNSNKVLSREEVMGMVTDVESSELKVKELCINMRGYDLFSIRDSNLLNILEIDNTVFLLPTDEYIYMMSDNPLQAISIFYTLYINLIKSKRSLEQILDDYHFRNLTNFIFKQTQGK